MEMPDDPLDVQVHPDAASGFARAARHYSQGRPGYPDGLVAWLRNTIELAPGRAVIELGAGTGQFTELLLRTGADVLAVEPSKQMRRELQSTFPQAQIAAGTAQAIPARSASSDAVVCAQAFHWFAQESAMAEIARVLRPAGYLVLVWNVPDERTGWVATIGQILDAAERVAPCQFKRGIWRHVFPDRRFTALERGEFEHCHQGTPDEVIIQRARSLSYIANLPPDEGEEIIQRLRHYIASHPALAGRSQIVFPYQTLAFHCRRTKVAALP